MKNRLCINAKINYFHNLFVWTNVFYSLEMKLSILQIDLLGSKSFLFWMRGNKVVKKIPIIGNDPPALVKMCL